jgi:RNA polymerase sigma-70 factor (ECF subfamily)
LVRHPEDLELVQRVIAGDRGAVSQFERRTRRIVGRSLRAAKATKRRVVLEADDLLQSLQVLLRADDARVLRSYRGESTLTTWIYTVAYRHFLSELRKREAHENIDDHDVRDPGDSPETQTMKEEERAAVRRALLELTDEDRLLLHLLIDRDAPSKAVATLLGITPDGVRMRKMRILRTLLKKLAGLWP